jgi:hypothetical protein
MQSQLSGPIRVLEEESKRSFATMRAGSKDPAHASQILEGDAFILCLALFAVLWVINQHSALAPFLYRGLYRYNALFRPCHHASVLSPWWVRDLWLLR